MQFKGVGQEVFSNGKHFRKHSVASHISFRYIFFCEVLKNLHNGCRKVNFWGHS